MKKYTDYHILKILNPITCFWWIVLSISSFSTNTLAAESSSTSIKTHYRISSGSLAILGQRVEQELLSIRPGEEPLSEETLESLVQKLSVRQFSKIIEQQTSGLSYEQVEFEIDHALQPYYRYFIDKLSDEEFAAIYRQYLGQVALDFIDRPPVQSNQEFIEFLLSSILELSEEEYSNLFRDYISSLWSFYISSATEDELNNILASNEELAELLGGNYAESLASALLIADDEIYFDALTQYINNLSNEEFVETYSAYVTETIGVLVAENFGATLGSLPIQLVSDADFLQPSSVSEGSEAADPSLESDLAANNSGTVTQFDALSEADSLRLLRQHISITGITHFISPFKASFIDSSFDYAEVHDQQLLFLKQDLLPSLVDIQAQFSVYYDQAPFMPGNTISSVGEMFLEELEDEQAFTANVTLALMVLIEQMNQEIQQFGSLELAILEPDFLLDVRQQLRLVENIEYPNLRLLTSAILNALEGYKPSSRDIQQPLTDWQFLFLMNAIVNSIETIEGNALISDAVASNTDEVWNFLGCGCDIEQENVIYGFYPTYLLPTTQQRQEIDLRFYDRIAYYGLTLDTAGDVSDDVLWANDGVMNEFIHKAHLRDTRVDLAIYAPSWDDLSHDKIEIASANIVDKLSIPLEYGSYLSGRALPPIGPTVEEVITRETMGDGVTLFFDNLEDPLTGEVKELNKIIDIVAELADSVDTNFGVDTTPINLMLDFKSENTAQVFQQLRPLFIGTDERHDHFVSRVLVFLEQDTLDSSQTLLAAIRTVFDDGNHASNVLLKINPILIPAMDQDGRFSSLASDLRGLRALFGVNGGSGIWPIPLGSVSLASEETSAGGEPESVDSLVISNPAEIDRQIESAFLSAMVDDSENGFIRGVRSYYFPYRQFIIFMMTLISVLSLFTFMTSIFEPTNRIILGLARWVGVYFLFALIWFLKIQIDPYISWARCLWFLVPIIVERIAGSFQHSASTMSVNVSGNKFLSRQLKRQKSRGLRRVRTKMFRGMRNLTRGAHGS